MATSTSIGRPPRGTTAHLRDLSEHRGSRAPQRLTPGTMVGRTFCVHHKIATGGMGEVWAGEHVLLRLRVAMKVLRPEAFGIPEVVARFQREAFLLAQIHSEQVARVLDFVDGRHGPVIVMELVEGPSLAAVLTSKRFAVEEAIELGMDIASALRELHAASVVHRDVKPANIILRPLRDGSHRAVFIDLGVSRMVAEGCERPEDEMLTEITAAHRALGTAEYMAPEQILSSRDVTPAADLYALGAILFRAVAGQKVFHSEHGADLMRRKLTTDPPPLETGRGDRVARGFEALVARLLTRKPEDRYETADELLADLSLLRDAARRVAQEHARLQSVPPPPRSAPARTPVPATPSRAARPSSRWRRSWRWVVAVAAFTLGAVGSMVLLRVVSARRAPAPPPAIAPAAAARAPAPPPSDVSAALATGQCTLVARDVDPPVSTFDGRRHMALSLACEAP